MKFRPQEPAAGPRPRQRARRFPVNLWAVERRGDEKVHHQVSNLSVTGMFLQKSVPIPVGTTFRVELPLPTGRTIRARGIVVHATSTEDGSGNGVTLSQLIDEDHDALVEFLSDLSLGGEERAA